MEYERNKKMIDFKEIEKCLTKPNIYFFFCALTQENGKDVGKKEYVMNANDGHVYSIENCPSGTKRFYNIKDRMIADIYPKWKECGELYTEWMIIAKYNLLVMVRWAYKELPEALNKLKVCDGTPDIGKTIPYSDSKAIFRLELPDDNIFPVEIATIDKEKNINDMKTTVKYPLDRLYRHNGCIYHSTFLEQTRNLEAFSEFFGFAFIGKNRYSTLRKRSEITAFMTNNDPTPKKSKKQDKLDELTKIVLKTPIKPNNADSYCYISKVDNEWSVVRWLREVNGKSYETYRLYVSKKEYIYCRSNLKGQFVCFNGKVPVYTFDAELTIMEDPDVFKGTKLEYFSAIYSSITQESLKAKALYMLVNYPKFELFWKSGLSEFCIFYISKHAKTSWEDYVKEFLGDLPDGKNLNNILCLNNHQISKFAKECYKYPSLLTRIRNAFGRNDLRDIDDQSFDAIFDFLIEQCSNPKNKDRLDYKFSPIFKVFRLLITNYSLKKAISLIPYIRTLVNEQQTYQVRSHFPLTYICYNLKETPIAIFEDVIRMVCEIEKKDKIKLTFNSLDELVNAHEMLIDVINMQPNKGNQNYSPKFEERQKFWAKFTYDGNKDYVVIAPNEPSDIAEEGIELHHCVRTYISSVAEGQTNILFIRKRESLEKPFFTVEISDNRRILQIHGFGNCNVSDEPGLKEFVEEWAKVINAKIDPFVI